MFRFLVILSAALALVAAVPAGDAPVAPAPLPDVPALPGITLPPRLDVPAAARLQEPAKLPGPLAGRTGADKMKYLKQDGGTADTEKAVALGLAWLAKQQKQDGSWVFDGTDKDETAAASAFALLAFLGAGETHKDVKSKYQKVVKAGLDSLAKRVPLNGPNAGKVAGTKTLYGQGIAALALCEAYAMTTDPVIKPYAQAAITYIVKAQAPNGSWGYTAGANGDTSILGWQAQALFVARSTNLTVPPKAITAAVGFLDRAGVGAAKAIYGYSDNAGAQPGTALTAVGLWTRTALDDWKPDTPGLVQGAEGLLKRPVLKNQLNLYYLHYATMVMKAVGGDAWDTWNEGPKDNDGARKGGLRDILVDTQVKDEGAKMGSWNPDLSFIGNNCGRLGTTALCVINLEAYYRYLPVEKKGAKKDADPKK